MMTLFQSFALLPRQDNNQQSNNPAKISYDDYLLLSTHLDRLEKQLNTSINELEHTLKQLND